MLTPSFEAPDELWHYQVVADLAHGHFSDPNGPARQEATQPPLAYVVGAALWRLVPAPDLAQATQLNQFFDFRATATDNKNVVHHEPADEAFPFQGIARTVHLLRLVTIVFGTLTIIGIFVLARTTFPQRPAVAALAVLFATLNPQVVFLAGTITNDLAIAATSTWSLVALSSYLTNRSNHSQPKTKWNRLAFLGLLLGLALLSKATAFGLLLLVCLAIVLGPVRGADWRRRLGEATAVAAIALVVGGWWYLRLWLLYRDPFGTVVRATGLGRTSPFTVGEAWRDLGELAVTFVARFGNSNVAAPAWITTVLVIVCLGGLFLGAFQARKASPGYWVNLIWIGLILVLFFIWQIPVPGAQGRLLFPAIGSLALVWGDGCATLFERLNPSIRRASMAGLGSGMLALGLALPVTVIRPAFPIGQTALIERLPPGLDVAQASFGQEATLVAYAPQPGDLRPGDRVTVELYWHRGSNPARLLRYDVHAVDHAGHVVAATDAPLAPDYPSTAWPADKLVKIQSALALPADLATPQVLRLEVGVYYLQNEKIQHVATQPGSVESVGLGNERIRPPNEAPGWAPLVRFGTSTGDEIGLEGWSIDPVLPVAGGVVSGRLIWDAERTPTIDYTVFVQVLRFGKLVAQSDAQPRAGAFPTSAFRPGETVPDWFSLALPADLSPGPVQLIVGLYDVKTLTRLRFLGGDAWPLTTLDVK